MKIVCLTKSSTQDNAPVLTNSLSYKAVFDKCRLKLIAKSYMEGRLIWKLAALRF